MKPPINIPIDEKGRKRIEREESKWTAPRLVGLGVISLGAYLLMLILVSHCQISPLPVP